MEVRAKDGSVFEMPDSSLLADILQPGGFVQLRETAPEAVDVAPDISSDQLRRLAQVLVANS